MQQPMPVPAQRLVAEGYLPFDALSAGVPRAGVSGVTRYFW